jgi:hypothetical protein
LDEIVHVAANTEACKNMKLTPSKHCARLSRQTAIWLTDGLNIKCAGDKGLQEFWVNQSIQLFKEGKADGLKNTKRSRIPAFFEIDTRAQAIYGKQ